MRILGLAIGMVISSGAFGQAPRAVAQEPAKGATAPSRSVLPAVTQEGRFQLTNQATIQDFQSMIAAIRLITEARDLSGDNASRILTVRGPAEEIALTGWLVKQLDQPAGAAVTPVAAEYKGLTDPDGHGGTEDEVARVYYLKNLPTVQDFQEIINAIRTTTEVRRISGHNGGRAMLFRGTPEQGAMVEWLAGELTRAPGEQQSVSAYRLTPDDVIQVLQVKNAKTIQDFQEIANDVRTVAEIRRMFTYNTGRAIVARGTPNQLAMEAWLVTQLDQEETQGNSSPEYREPGAADDVTQVFYLPQVRSVQAFQQDAAAIRNALGIRRIFTYNAIRAISVRGSGSQLALAQKMVEDLSK